LGKLNIAERTCFADLASVDIVARVKTGRRRTEFIPFIQRVERN